MSKKPRFNYIYNDDKKIGIGKGYYIIYENCEGQPTYDSYCGVYEYSEKVDMVTVGILNRIKYLIDMGYKFDPYYTCDLKDLF